MKHKDLMLLIKGMAVKVQAKKFHTCMTLPHDTFDSIPLKVISSGISIYNLPSNVPTTVYSKVQNHDEQVEIVYQCEDMTKHQHAHYASNDATS